MPRYKLNIEYDGSAFSGWQIQKHAVSVQETLQNAIKKTLNEETKIVCAGRTDAGVHAINQVAHLDINKEMDLFKIQESINNNVNSLPVAITKVENVSNNFHARKDAISRHYIYKIINRYPRLTFQSKKYLHVRKQLDIQTMQECCKLLIGTKDFSSFRASACQSISPIKTIYASDIYHDREYIEIHFIGSSFLQHQVRNMVGTLLLAGHNRISVNEFNKIINAKNRSAAGPTIDSDGLYLFKVNY